MENITRDNGTIAREVTRRTAVQGAAWSVPIIAAAVAAPLAAASTQNPLPDLRIVLLQNAPTNGQVQYWADNGEPGYHANKQLTHHIQVGNFGAAAATGFTLNLQLHAASYDNGSIEIATGDGWEFIGGSSTPNTTITLRFRWTGTIGPGQSTECFLRLRVSQNLPANQTHVVPIAAITSVVEGESNTNNNSQVGTPNYWVS